MSLGQGEDSGAEVGFATARGRDWPSVRQFNVFVENRIGGLMNVVRRFETSDNRIVSLTVVDTADCAIIRLVVSDPERAAETLEQAGLPYAESDLVVVQLPAGKQPLLEIFKALLLDQRPQLRLLVSEDGVGLVGADAGPIRREDHRPQAIEVLELAGSGLGGGRSCR